jgi:hypothetical protein
MSQSIARNSRIVFRDWPDTLRFPRKLKTLMPTEKTIPDFLFPEKPDRPRILSEVPESTRFQEVSVFCGPETPWIQPWRPGCLLALMLSTGVVKILAEAATGDRKMSAQECPLC